MLNDSVKEQAAKKFKQILNSSLNWNFTAKNTDAVFIFKTKENWGV